MLHLKAILFDLDGVLIDSYYLWFHLLNGTTHHFHFPPITLDAFHSTWGQGIEADIAAFMPGLESKLVQDYYAEHYKDHLDQVRIFPDAALVLSRCRNIVSDRSIHQEAIHIGCITNTPGKLARSILLRADLLTYFDAVIGADEAGVSKPAPDGVLKLCELFRVKPSEALLVGDSAYDQGAAAAAGCRFVGLQFGPEQRIESLLQLLDWLQPPEDVKK